MNYTIVVVGGFFFVAIIWWFAWASKNFHGPVRTASDGDIPDDFAVHDSANDYQMPAIELKEAKASGNRAAGDEGGV